MRQSNIFPLKKLGFSNILAKNSPEENFPSLKSSAPIKNDVPNSAKQRTNGHQECVCKKRTSMLRNAMGNGECGTCLRKIQKLQPFFEEN